MPLGFRSRAARPPCRCRTRAGSRPGCSRCCWSCRPTPGGRSRRRTRSDVVAVVDAVVRESAAFDVPALTCAFENVAPPSVENAGPVLRVVVHDAVGVAGAWSPMSARESYQETARLPDVGSSEIFGRNWLLALASLLTLTGALHVAPRCPSGARARRCRRSRSCSPRRRRGTRARGGRRPSGPRPGPDSASTERPDWGGMKSKPPMWVWRHEDAVAERRRAEAIRVDVHEQLAAALPALGEGAHLHDLAARADGDVAVRAVVRPGDDLARGRRRPTWPRPVTGAPAVTIGPPALNDDPDLAVTGGDGGLVDEPEQPAPLPRGPAAALRGRLEKPRTVDVGDDVEGQPAVGGEGDGRPRFSTLYR